MNSVSDAEKLVGLTGTVPVEVIFAAGLVPVDLNNRFITAPDREAMIAAAEARGFPANLCAWIKGLYGAAMHMRIQRVVGITRGDCSSTEKLMEVWRHEGIATVPFAYPATPDPDLLQPEIDRFARAFGVTTSAAEAVRERLRPVRALLRELDELTWHEGKVTGHENHLWLVSASDFFGDPDLFTIGLDRFLETARARPSAHPGLRLGYVGVPPIVDGLHDFLESRGARVVFNEVQRQFALLADEPGLARAYARYTYPYDTFYRIADIAAEARRRNLAGIIHYAQTFCHRQLEAIVLRERLSLPVLTIEADRPGPLDARTRTRLEAFLEQIR